MQRLIGRRFFGWLLWLCHDPRRQISIIDFFLQMTLACLLGKERFAPLLSLKQVLGTIYSIYNCTIILIFLPQGSQGLGNRARNYHGHNKTRSCGRRPGVKKISVKKNKQDHSVIFTPIESFTIRMKSMFFLC
jgi:hypothetical protein